ncbi:hypothetical protein [Neobacillus sp. PS3-40]|uniref:hypothetical protein n=1 Tax=Neobacillus sp. PS3-40 TaxID=3070679 RepID=UPI0027DF74A2|nr:hypothetical protein [Neobacillus sp. PS3-40]WML45550.1 hypothetical protein RCG20_06510 [Neobacillus sp. PS3-40]
MMLVEINLLPKKEPRRFGFIITIFLLFILVLLVAVFYYYQISTTKTNIETADKQITIVRKIAEAQSEKVNKSKSPDSVKQLKAGIVWANSYRIQTIPVMQHLTSLLPERGFIQSFKYVESGTVTLTVQFDTASEAAYYLNSLNHSKWIDAASLNSLNAESENSSLNSTSQTNQTNSPADTSQTNTGNSITENDANLATSSNGSVSQSSLDYLPRYIGQFAITFNQEKVKKIIKDTNKDGNIEEGVTVP